MNNHQYIEVQARLGAYQKGTVANLQWGPHDVIDRISFLVYKAMTTDEWDSYNGSFEYDEG